MTTVRPVQLEEQKRLFLSPQLYRGCIEQV
jgi:hypothetical protein